MSTQQTIERVFDAPLALIWELWTTAAGRGAWYGPRGFVTEVHRYELHVGGAFDYTMRAGSPEMAANMEKMGRPPSFTVNAVITAIEPMTHLAWRETHGSASIDTAVTFTEQPEGVHMTLVLAAATEQQLGGAAMGWRSTLDRLEEQLAQGA